MASTYISLPVATVTGDITVNLDASTDSVAIKDGANQLNINPDGSININIGGNVINEYNEITSVASSGSFTNILSYSPGMAAKLKYASVSGTNIAEYRVVINSNTQSRKFTYFGGNLSLDFDFRDGIDLIGSDVVTLQVRHSRTDVGDFFGNIIVQI